MNGDFDMHVSALTRIFRCKNHPSVLSEKHEDQFIAAAKEGRTDAVISLLDKYGGHIVNAKDDYGRTALHKASLYGRKDTVKALLDSGADVNAKDIDGETPLYKAVWNGGAVDVVELLLNYGADIDAKSRNGMTALMWASQLGRDRVVEVIRQWAEKHKYKLVDEIMTGGIGTAVKAGPRLVLRRPS